MEWANETRIQQGWLIWLLPLGGAAIALLYRLCGMEQDQGTNLVITSVRSTPVSYTHLVADSIVVTPHKRYEKIGCFPSWRNMPVKNFLNKKDFQPFHYCFYYIAYCV